MVNASDEIKGNVLAIMDTETREKLKRDFIRFLREVRAECRCICGDVMEDKLRDIGKHVKENHWLGAEGA